ncbi:hypothetical protein, partial [Pectinatus frisingensis]|uniref:hypothetical protein n=1 Tax=Pectinatus frisingensis TaxID=865 RepID=UPI0018C4C1BA
IAAAVKKLGVAVSPVAGNCFLGVAAPVCGLGAELLGALVVSIGLAGVRAVQGTLRFSGACG